MIIMKKKLIKTSLNGPRKRISGVVKINGVPASRLVRVYSGIGGGLLAQKLSMNDGEYSFILPNRPSYTIVAIDHKHQFNAVIQDNVVPK